MAMPYQNGDASQPTPEPSPPPLRPRILDLFDAANQESRPLYISAPMVRYSKLPFRLLARHYSTDVTYVPMMLAREFVRSPVARDSDFTTHPSERAATAADGRGHAVIAQFAASEPEEFARAAAMVAPWVDGVDLNCGCPQAWALREGIGCGLMGEAAGVAAMVRAARGRVGEGRSVSVKIRIHKDLSETLSFLRIVAAAGPTYITIHARTRSQRSSTPPDLHALRTLTAFLSSLPNPIPVVANGDAYTLADVHQIAKFTGARGVMAARGILENPAMFAGHTRIPRGGVDMFMEFVVRCPIPFELVRWHVGEMLGKTDGKGEEGMDKRQRRRLLECDDLVDLVEFLEGEGWMGRERGDVGGIWEG